MFSSRNEPSGQLSAPAPRDPQRDSTGSDPDRGGENITLRDLFVVLRRHLLLLFVVSTVCVALTAYYVVRQPRRYRAIALLQLTEARQSITQAIQYSDPKPRSSEAPLSQIQVLKSRAVVGTVVDSTGLRLRPATPRFPYALLTEVRIDSAVGRDSFFVTVA